MVQTPSTMVALGTRAPDFSLPEPATGETIGLADVSGAQGLLVVFLSNHCPFVKHLADHFAVTAAEYQKRGIAVVGIMANDVEKYPDDHPDRMKEEVERRGYTFPYLYDESQEVAKAFNAACTPDFFLFDERHELVYRGQYDASRPSLDIEVTGSDLRSAMDALLAGAEIPQAQAPSVGCNIKWKAGNAPAWFG